MNKETYDNYEKKIQELKDKKNKIIIKIKKKELEKTNYIEKNNLEIKERLIDIIKTSGFRHLETQDLVKVSKEYQYLVFFTK